MTTQEQTNRLIEQIGSLRRQQALLVDALLLIDRTGCTNQRGNRCSEDRIRGYRYSADAWCDACIAADALTKLDVDTYNRPIETWGAFDRQAEHVPGEGARPTRCFASVQAAQMWVRDDSRWLIARLR